MIFSTLEEAALHFGRTTRSMERWLERGVLKRVTLDDGGQAFEHVGHDADDAPADRAQREDSPSDTDMSDIDLGVAADRPAPSQARGSDGVHRVATASSAAARLTRRLRDLVGAAYVATLSAAEAVADLVAAADEQARYEEAFSMVEPLPGQPGEAAWRALASAVAACLADLRRLLDRREVDDAALAGAALALRDAERRWRDVRRWEVERMPGDAEPLRIRAADEARLFDEARAALREALTA